MLNRLLKVVGFTVVPIFTLTMLLGARITHVGDVESDAEYLCQMAQDAISQNQDPFDVILERVDPPEGRWGALVALATSTHHASFFESVYSLRRMPEEQRYLSLGAVLLSELGSRAITREEIVDWCPPLKAWAEE